MPFVDAEIARERQFVNFGNLFLRSPSFRTLFFFFVIYSVEYWFVMGIWWKTSSHDCITCKNTLNGFAQMPYWSAMHKHTLVFTSCTCQARVRSFSSSLSTNPHDATTDYAFVWVSRANVTADRWTITYIGVSLWSTHGWVHFDPMWRARTFWQSWNMHNSKCSDVHNMRMLRWIAYAVSPNGAASAIHRIRVSCWYRDVVHNVRFGNMHCV